MTRASRGPTNFISILIEMGGAGPWTPAISTFTAGADPERLAGPIHSWVLRARSSTRSSSAAEPP